MPALEEHSCLIELCKVVNSPSTSCHNNQIVSFETFSTITSVLIEKLVEELASTSNTLAIQSTSHKKLFGKKITYNPLQS